MSNNEKVLVYHYRGDGSVVKDNLAEIIKNQLVDILEKHPKLQATTKAITDSDRDSHGDVSLDIRQNDLYTPKQKEMYKSKSLFNYYSNIAGVDIKRKVARQHDELTILSKKKD